MVDTGKIITDVLTNFERFQYLAKTEGLASSDVIYHLYSSVLKAIGKLLSKEKRNNRIFRLKYHHILSDESVDEYLFHCLSKILTDIFETDNNYHKYIQPVVELHMKLLSTLTAILERHTAIVLQNCKVKYEIEKYKSNGKKWKSLDEESASEDFVPIYFLPVQKINSKLKKSQHLTFQALFTHYKENNCLSADIEEMLLDFDDEFAEFELKFVCKVNKTSILSKEAAEMTMNVAALFAESIEWAHRKGLIKYSSIADCEIELMVSIPRIVILYGCAIAQDGPLSENSLNCRDDEEAESRLAPVFASHSVKLSRLRRQLGVLNELEITHLTQLLIQHSELSTNITSTSLQTSKPMYSFSGNLHSLFIMIASVADQMQTTHASDFRFLMELMHKLYKDEPDTIDVDPTVRSKIKRQSGLKIVEIKPFGRLQDNLVDEEGMDALVYRGSSSSSSCTSSSSSSSSNNDANIGDSENMKNKTVNKNLVDFNGGGCCLSESSSLTSSPAISELNLSTTATMVAETESQLTPPNQTISSAAQKIPYQFKNQLITNNTSTEVSHSKCSASKRSRFTANQNDSIIKGDVTGSCDDMYRSEEHFADASTSSTVAVDLEYFSCREPTTRPRPLWRDDSAHPHCCHCRSLFNLFRRRHHCRRCGFVFCRSCWGTKLPLPTLGVTNRVPVCIECEEFITKRPSSPTAPSTPVLSAAVPISDETSGTSSDCTINATSQLDLVSATGSESPPLNKNSNILAKGTMYNSCSTLQTTSTNITMNSAVDLLS